jgi:DNA topoisomerase-1
MAARKKKNLVIVESPAKAKTINKYLGPDYEVVASKGHVRDLIKSRIGIDIEKGWIPNYRDLADRKEVIAFLKKHVKASGTVYLAPDPDREGEAIAWHLKESLKLDDDRIRRVTFNEITKNAVQNAFAHAGTINMDLVAAQEARRFLDRVVGYKLSPLVSQRLANPELSAGRVQSVAVRLIVEREREISAFKPEEYWKIFALLRGVGRGAKGEKKVEAIIIRPADIAKGPPVKSPVGDAAEDEADEKQANEAEDAPTTPKAKAKAAELPLNSFEAELAEWSGEKFKAGTTQTVEPIVDQLSKASWVISKIENKERQERPPAPFTTSTLQQQASLRLHFTAKKTMMIAQKLYEGVELGGEGSVALITYMRTDSTRIADDALKNCRGYIKMTYGDAYLPDKPMQYAASKDAQGAHECVRPTDVAYTPERVASSLVNSTFKADLVKLYTLIYQRFVACQMKPAVFAVTSVEVKAVTPSKNEGLFRAQGRTLKFDGFRKVLVPAGKSEDTLLPELKQDEKLDLLKLKPSQHFTEPPPRYNEASLVKTLEKEGIGRPSTYATIMGKIEEKKYVEKKDRRFWATDLGMKVTDLLVENFPKVMDIQFTRHMEEELDHIETRKSERNQVLNEFYEPFAQDLKVAETKMMADAEKCPLCGRHLVERFSRFGKFFGCSGATLARCAICNEVVGVKGTGAARALEKHNAPGQKTLCPGSGAPAGNPECKYIKKKGGEKAEPPRETEFKCPKCGHAMLERMGRRGKFLGCSRYPECKTTMNFGPEGKPVLASEETSHVCEKCGKPMVLRQGKRGPFLACSGYPKCKNAKDVDAKGNPMQPIDSGIACEKCGSPMWVKKGPRGPFLACSAYPKCRSNKALTAELKEKYKDVFPAPPPKKEGPKVEVTETCPECDGPMKLRPGRGSYFLGCAKYPKCKGTLEAPAELLEKMGGNED